MAPDKARFAACRGQVTAVGPGARPTFWTGAALNGVVGTEARPLQGGDLAKFVRIADALPNVFAVVGTSVEEVPPAVRDVVGFRILAENSTKHLRPPTTRRSAGRLWARAPDRDDAHSDLAQDAQARPVDGLYLTAVEVMHGVHVSICPGPLCCLQVADGDVPHAVTEHN